MWDFRKKKDTKLPKDWDRLTDQEKINWVGPMTLDGSLIELKTTFEGGVPYVPNGNGGFDFSHKFIQKMFQYFMNGDKSRLNSTELKLIEHFELYEDQVSFSAQVGALRGDAIGATNDGYLVHSNLTQSVDLGEPPRHGYPDEALYAALDKLIIEIYEGTYVPKHI